MTSEIASQTKSKSVPYSLPRVQAVYRCRGGKGNDTRREVGYNAGF